MVLFLLSFPFKGLCRNVVKGAVIRRLCTFVLVLTRQITSLIVGCAPGPGGLGAEFNIKLASKVLIFPLCLFNLFLFTCKLASIWKCAKVT